MKNIRLFQVLFAISMAIERKSSDISEHHIRTAFIINELAQELGLTREHREKLYIAAYLHDIGGLTESDIFLAVDDNEPYSHEHALNSFYIYKAIPMLADKADIVRYHHVHWNEGLGAHQNGAAVPFESNLLYLADRIDITFQLLLKSHDRHPLESCINTIKRERGKRFRGEFVDAFLRVAQKESFWLSLKSELPVHLFKQRSPIKNHEITFDQLMDFGVLLTILIDLHSHFTMTHSLHVGYVASSLAALCGYDNFTCRKIELAGYLHDLGKLAIPSHILHKRGKLTADEFMVMKGHSYYTYEILSVIDAIPDIARWAGYHHEKLNGQGYPFHLDNYELEQEGRMVSVADIFTALVEARPYRPGMTLDEVQKIMRAEVAKGALDPLLVELLITHIYEIEEKFIPPVSFFNNLTDKLFASCPV